VNLDRKLAAVARQNNGLVGTPLCIQLSGFDRSADEILAAAGFAYDRYARAAA